MSPGEDGSEPRMGGKGEGSGRKCASEHKGKMRAFLSSLEIPLGAGSPWLSLQGTNVDDRSEGSIIHR